MINVTTSDLEVLRAHAIEDAPATADISTIPALLLNFAAKFQKPSAFKCKQGARWVDVSTDDFVARVEALFFAMQCLGVGRGDRVAIMSENRLEWGIVDYAAAFIGAVTVPIYPTLAPQQVEALVQDSECSMLFVSTAALMEKVKAIRYRVPSVRYVVAFDDLQVSGVLQMAMLYAMGHEYRSRAEGQLRQSAALVSPDDVATIIYTSGTTGVPKGAMLTHRNLTSNIAATLRVLPLSSADITLSFLPLSHIFQRHVNYACAYAGSTIAYCENVANVAEDMMEVRPTFAGGVPRFFERIYARIWAQARASSPLKRALFHSAINAGLKHTHSSRQPLLYRAADHLVYHRIREKLGGRLRFFISGGAPLEREIAEFFFAVGLPIYEGYGLSETSPVITLNGPDTLRIGTVGRPVGDVEVRIEGDGEIAVRGSNVMRGYFRMPAETASVLKDGWFYTGDIGDFDKDGFLRILDRKKDIIVTSSGKNIAPQPIENRLRMIPYFDNVVVVGDGRNYLSALIVPNYDALAAYAQRTGIDFDNPVDLIQKPEIRDLAMREIDQRTQDLADFEKIRKIAFIEKAFTVDGEEITPTMKVRRLVVQKKYQSDIDRLYAA